MIDKMMNWTSSVQAGVSW